MTQTKLTAKPVAQIGEEIGLELGTQMVKTYQEANPTDVQSYLIGREIIDQILAQPGCAGIKLFNAYNELGEKTLVYIGVNAEGKSLVQISTVNHNGQLTTEKGIVADRILPNRDRSGSRVSDDQEWWESD